MLSEDMVSVNLVDYGHRITLDKNNLRSITPRLLSLPFQAVHCSLAGTFSEEIYLVQDLLIHRCIRHHTGFIVFSIIFLFVLM